MCKKIKYHVIVPMLLLLSWAGGLKAQQVEYIAEIDTNYIMIGDQIHLRMKVKADPDVTVTFPYFRDTLIKGVEIISGPRRDSIPEKDGRVLYQESYLITAFDTGVYVIPELPIRIEKQDYANVLRTEPLHLIVNTFVVEDEKGNYDIYMPVDAPWTFSEILPYLLWGLLGLVVIAGIVLLIIRIRSRKPLFVTEKPPVPPYVLVIQALDGIKEEKPWQYGKTKEYYTQLTEALRVYMEGELDVPAMEQTSYEILQALEQVEEVQSEDRRKLAGLLETADLVKFAKASPLSDENAHNLDVAYTFVNHTNEAVEKNKAIEHARIAREMEEQKAREQAEREDAEKMASEKADTPSGSDPE